MITPKTVSVVLSDAAMRKAALRAIAIIRTRTLSGIGVDANGNAYPLPEYSDEPFAMPAGGVTREARRVLKSRLRYFKTKDGATWVVVEGGYRALKMARYPQHGGVVNLSATGRMLRALTIVGMDPATGRAQIGFTRLEEAQKAAWAALRGRTFLGLTTAEQEEVARIAAQSITLKV